MALTFAARLSGPRPRECVGERNLAIESGNRLAGRAEIEQVVLVLAHFRIYGDKFPSDLDMAGFRSGARRRMSVTYRPRYWDAQASPVVVSLSGLYSQPITP